MSDVKKPFGIDLGTTYSAIAHLDAAGRPEVIGNSEGDRTTPSVIVFDPSGEIVVGREAKNEAVLNPDRVVEMVKRYMGSEGWQRTIDGVDWTPEKLSAQILRKLVRDAAEATGVPVEDVVITHPAYFTDVERAATRAAGQIAGLNVLGLIEEPVAAAYAYSMTAEEELEGSILVYDLGGGTFDACVITVSRVGDGKDIRVLVTEGQRTLGGKDWDARTLGYALSEFSIKTGMDFDAYASGAMGEESATRYAQMLQELTSEVEKAKFSLTMKPKARIPVSFENERATIELTLEQFDDMTADLLLQTIDLTRQAIDTARDKGIENIDTVLLVGGSSRMKQVAAAVTKLMGFEPRLFEPDLAVAKGAAFVAMHLEFIKPMPVPDGGDGQAPAPPVPVTPQEARDRAEKLGVPAAVAQPLIDNSCGTVTSHALGVVAVDDSTAPPSYRVSHIIPRQTPLPCNETRTYGTYDEGQQIVSIEVKQGDSDIPEDCHDLGQVELHLPRPMPRGTPIDVTFTMDAEGLLAVTGLQPDTGAIVNAPVQRPAIISDGEIAAAAAQHSAISMRD